MRQIRRTNIGHGISTRAISHKNIRPLTPPIPFKPLRFIFGFLLFFHKFHKIAYVLENKKKWTTLWGSVVQVYIYIYIFLYKICVYIFCTQNRKVKWWRHQNSNMAQYSRLTFSVICRRNQTVYLSYLIFQTIFTSNPFMGGYN